VLLARAEPVEAPDFLFFGILRERMGRTLSARGLDAEPGRMLRIHLTERAARRAALGGNRGRGRARIFVIEGARAQRGGVVFLRGEPGVLLANGVPRRFLLSERPGFERQVSAGAVLVRKGQPDARGFLKGAELDFDIALIRTRPRADAEAEAEEEPEVPVAASSDELPVVVAAIPPEEEPRSDSDRRQGEERRKQDLGPPGGIERRAGPRRRRRRRGGWGASGRMELPKGKLEKNEQPREAAIRELREETGLATPVSLVRELPRVRYAFRTPEGKSVYKVVHYFLFLSTDSNPVFVPQGKEGIVAVEWTSLRHALETIAFGNLKPVLEAARDALLAPPPAGAPPAEEESEAEEEP
ncbi:MAG: NUDIX domain-containing protein, partial [Planctomycetota bacterium]